MKNIQDIGNDEISGKKLYILESAEKNQEEKVINIIGKINDKTFLGQHLILTILSADKDNEVQVNCDVIKIRKKYKLSCEPKSDIEGELDGAMGKLDGENLVINFKKVKDSSIKFKKPEEKENIKNAQKSSPPENKKLHLESKEKSKEDDLEDSGIITIQILIYIIIGIICFLIFIIIYNIFCKKRKPISKEKQQEESNSMSNINNYTSDTEIK